MKKRYITMLLLIMAMLLPLYAVPSENGAGTEGGTGGGMEWQPVYRLIRSADLNIRAYKNTPDPIKMVIFDALTGNLEEISNTQQMDIYPYIGKFLSTTYTDSLLKEVPESEPEKWKIADKSKVLFSYLVTGSSTGKYTLEITLGSFYRTDLPAGSEDIFIKTHYELGDMGVSFPSAGGSKTLGDNTIDFVQRPATGTDPLGKADGKLSVVWSVTNPYDNKTQDFWNSEGVVIMALDKVAYDDSPAGSFKADVTVHLKVE